jgi:hypothetical protein
MRMKNKKLIQLNNRQKHRELLRSERKNEPAFERDKPTKNEKPSILIVCEGKNTEPSYFRQFRLSSATVEAIGEGFNTLSLVKRAIEISGKNRYDKKWVVFDRDTKPDNPSQASDFNEAIKLAKKNGFEVAYSNQAFEYWIILHFNDHQGGPMDRRQYGQKINEWLVKYNTGYDSEHSKTITDEIFELLDGIDEQTKKERKRLAIIRAKRNYKLFDHKNPAAEESSTTVYKLVEELLRYL